MSRTSKSTPTSYAILGLLAIRPWTTYELTQQMKRSFDRFWPRAESKLYEEPKKLVALGWATRTDGHTGRRRRTVYAITDDGRHALMDWLGQPSQPPLLESEHMVKVFLAEHGSKSNLQAALVDLQVWAARRASDDSAIALSYLKGEGQFHERAALVTLVGKYSADFALMTSRWASWAQSEVARWPEDLSAAPPSEEVLRQIASLGADSPDAGPPDGT